VEGYIESHISNPSLYLYEMADSIWGPVVSSDTFEDEEDPIQRMLEELEKLKKEMKMNPDETIGEFRERKAKLVNELESKIDKAIHKKNMIKLAKAGQ
jgi:hypothetical protein